MINYTQVVEFLHLEHATHLPEDARVAVSGLHFRDDRAGTAVVLGHADGTRKGQEDGRVVVDVLHENDERLRDELPGADFAVGEGEEDLVLGLRLGIEHLLEKDRGLSVLPALYPNQARRRSPEPELHPVPVGVVPPEMQYLGARGRLRPLLEPDDDVAPVAVLAAAVEDKLGRRVRRSGHCSEGEDREADGADAVAAHLPADDGVDVESRHSFRSDAWSGGIAVSNIGEERDAGRCCRRCRF